MQMFEKSWFFNNNQFKFYSKFNKPASQPLKLFTSLTFFWNKSFFPVSLAVFDDDVGGVAAHLNDGGHTDFVDPLDGGRAVIEVSLLSSAKTYLTVGALNLRNEKKNPVILDLVKEWLSFAIHDDWVWHERWQFQSLCRSCLSSW